MACGGVLPSPHVQHNEIVDESSFMSDGSMISIDEDNKPLTGFTISCRTQGTYDVLGHCDACLRTPNWRLISGKEVSVMDLFVSGWFFFVDEDECISSLLDDLLDYALSKRVSVTLCRTLLKNPGRMNLFMRKATKLNMYTLELDQTITAYNRPICNKAQ